IGWVLQDRGWVDYTAEGAAGAVFQKVLEELEIARGPSAAALGIIMCAIDLLQASAPGDSWVMSFSREHPRGKDACVHGGVVETGEAADVFVSLLGCLIEARASITQVLVFKYRNEHASFKANSAKVSINSAAVQELLPAIRTKVRAYQADYVSSIKDI